jgi:DNA repair protein RadC
MQEPAPPSEQQSALSILLKLLGMGGHADGLAALMLHRFGSIGGILQAETAELSHEFGLTPLAIAHIQTVARLHDIALTETLPERIQLGSTSALNAYFVGKLRHSAVEKCLAVFLDHNDFVIADHVCAVGNANSVRIDPCSILRVAISRDAAAIAIAHNHPSGRAEPSEADTLLTQRLCDAAATVGIGFFDHVIVARNSLFSYAAENLLRTRPPACHG